VNLRKYVPDSARPVIRRGLRRVGELTSGLRTTPSFIVIGGQRCGTTTIFNALAGHRQVLRPLVDKGTDYYTLHYSRGLAWYRSRMPLAVTARQARARHGQAQVFEACTYYMFHPFAIERLAADFPDIKLVVMLRDPVARAYSAYKHELARGFETENDFLTALQLENERLAGEYERMRDDPTYESFSHRHQAYLARGRFAEQLERVYTHYSRTQVHVLQSESFFADPHAEFARLTDFLGLSPWAPDSFGQHNPRPSAPMPEPAHEFLADYYRPRNAELAQLLGAAPAWDSGGPANAETPGG
jgi:hypothetical protein